MTPRRRNQDIDPITNQVVSVAGQFIGSTTDVVTAITVTASVFTYQNTSQRMIAVYISGGTVSVVSIKRGTTTVQVFAGTNVTVTLLPSDSVLVTYTGAPTMKWQNL